MNERKVTGVSEKQHVTSYLRHAYAVSECRTCKVLSINRNAKRAHEHRSFANETNDVIIEESRQEPRWGHGTIHARMKLGSHQLGPELVRRFRTREGPQVSHKQHKSRHPEPTMPLRQAAV